MQQWANNVHDPPPREVSRLQEDTVSFDTTTACSSARIPHFELHHTQELFRQNQAATTRTGVSAGEGVPFIDQLHHHAVEAPRGWGGPVPLSQPMVEDALYDQGFVSMSAVPSVYVGVYTDPVTGEEYDAYESAIPPPDADHEESAGGAGRNVKLAHLQGGWADTTPRASKTEVVEDEFHQVYDRTTNTYGTYDPSRKVEAFLHNNRFNHDGQHPDAEGQLVTGVPANTMGNQGTVIVRHTPYVKPTFRGHVDHSMDDMFRGGAGGVDVDMDVMVDDDDHQTGTAQLPRMAYEYTTQPFEQALNPREQGGGVWYAEAASATLAQPSVFDARETYRGTHAGPVMMTAAPGSMISSHKVDGDVAPSRRLTGTVDAGGYAIGNPGLDAFTPTLQSFTPSNALTGTVSHDTTTSGGTAASGHAVWGSTHTTFERDVPTTKSGTTTAGHQVTRGAKGADSVGSRARPSAHSAMSKTKRQQLAQVQVAFDSCLGNLNATPTTRGAARTRHNTKSDIAVDFLLPGATLAGTDSLIVNAQQAHGLATSVDTKRQAVYESHHGASSGVDMGVVAPVRRVHPEVNEHQDQGMATTAMRGSGAAAPNVLQSVDFFRDTTELVGK